MKLDRVALLLLRVYVGFLFCTSGWEKWTADPPFTTGDALTGYLSKCHASAEPDSISAALIHSYYIPNVKALSWLVVIGEIGVGAALMSGTATRLACAAGIFMNANFLIASAGTFRSFDNNAFFILIQFALLTASAGRFFGVDYFLSKKFSNSYLW